jgi:conjugative transfer signal peptidase TraF
MMARQKRTSLMNRQRCNALAAVGLVAVGFLIAWWSGYSLAVNTSVSMPRGLYLVGPLAEPKRGDIISLCIPNLEAAKVYRERHYMPPSERCRSGLPPVLKPVVGMPGDVVLIDATGTWINGIHLRNSMVFDTDSQGMPIQHLPTGWSKRLDAGEYFMLANHIERSLDSRYYGTVQRGDMLGCAVSLITF